MRYRASKFDCDACSLKPRCCPNTPARKIPRSIHEGARDMARDIAETDAYVTSRRERKKVEMLFAHLKRILRLDRLRLGGPNGARDEFHLAAAAQNFSSPSSCRTDLRSGQHERAKPNPLRASADLTADFINDIGASWTTTGRPRPIAT
jgi:hypothetical protein